MLGYLFLSPTPIPDLRASKFAAYSNIFHNFHWLITDKE